MSNVGMESAVLLIVLLIGVLGCAIGSFLNVVIWRVPRGESIIRPPSHCPDCDRAIRPRDNVPVLGWLLLRGRCRDCDSRISSRYPLVELGTGLLFAAIAIKVGLQPVLPAYLYLAAISVALALIDLDVKRLPDKIVLPSYLVALVLLGAAAIAGHDYHAYLRAIEGMVAYYGAFFALAFIYPAGMGFGDVKLAGVLGLYLGWIGWGALVVGAFGGILIGGLVGLGLMAARRAGRKSAIPFGPFMLVGALLSIFVGASVLHAYLRTTGLA